MDAQAASFLGQLPTSPRNLSAAPILCAVYTVHSGRQERSDEYLHMPVIALHMPVIAKLGITECITFSMTKIIITVRCR